MSAIHARPRDDVRSWSAGLPEEFIQCRDFGHLWRPYRAHFDAANNCYERVIRCGRCRTERSQHVGLSGELLSGAYSYPAGYQAPAGSGRLDSGGRAELRLESTLRLMGHDGGKD